MRQRNNKADCRREWKTTGSRRVLSHVFSQMNVEQRVSSEQSIVIDDFLFVHLTMHIDFDYSTANILYYPITTYIFVLRFQGGVWNCNIWVVVFFIYFYWNRIYWPYNRTKPIHKSVTVDGVLILKDENIWHKWVHINSIFDNNQSTARTVYIKL